MTKTTRAQREAIYRKWVQWSDHDPARDSYRKFRSTVQPTSGCDGAVTVFWCRMWLCIERDGYTHS